MKGEIGSQELAVILSSKMLIKVGRERMRGEAGKPELERLLSNINAVGFMGDSHDGERKDSNRLDFVCGSARANCDRDA